ncbi:MAG: hypothetical protein WBG43_02545 [Marinifilaceae bacterium]
MKKILITFICLILTVMSLFAQKTEYYKLLRQAEQKIIDQQLDSTLYYYDKAFTKYDYPFARDLYAATCISLHTDNTATLYKYVELLLKKGISLDDLDFIVKHKPNDKRLQKFKEEYPRYKKEYLSSLNLTLRKKFRDLNKQEKIDLLVIEESVKKKYRRSAEFAHCLPLVKRFIELVKEYGYPSEKLLGLGSSSGLIRTDVKNPEPTFEESYEMVNEPIIESRKNIDVLFWYTNKSFRVNCHRNRTPQYFLWHLNLKRLPELNSILLKAFNNLEFDPSFYAACLEFHHWEDYGMSMSSVAAYKYKFNLKKLIKKPEAKQINENRKKLFLRSLEKDLELFNAIAKLEHLKYKKCFNLRVRHQNNELFWALFIDKMP